MVSGTTGIHVLGIAIVASRDWRNFAGTDGTSWQRGHVASLVAIVMFFAALIIVLVSCAPYRNNLPAGEVPAVHPVSLIAGVAIAAGLPILLGMTRHHFALTAVGQFALWWSVPWGAGIIAAGSARAPAARRAARASVLISVAITGVCAAVSPMFDFGLRLPEG